MGPNFDKGVGDEKQGSNPTCCWVILRDFPKIISAVPCLGW